MGDAFSRNYLLDTAGGGTAVLGVVPAAAVVPVAAAPATAPVAPGWVV